MKSETKAKRRVTLSICGLGYTDESELDTMRGAKRVLVNPETGEIEGEEAIGGKDESPTGDYTIVPKGEPAPSPAPEIPIQTMQVRETTAAAPEIPPAEPKRGRGRPAKAATSPQDQSAAVAPSSAPHAAPESPTGSVAPNPAPAEAVVKVEYQIYTEPQENGPLKAVLTEPTYQKPEVAEDRANKLAAQTGVIHVVMRIENGKMRQHVKTKPSPAPEPAAEPKTKGIVAQRLEALTKFMNIPGQTAMARYNQYFCGFFDIPGIAELGKAAKTIPAERKDESMDALELSIWRDAKSFNADPVACGKQTALIMAGIQHYAANNWKAAATLAWKVAIFWGFSVANFEKWSENIGLDFQNSEDATAFFRVCLRTPQNRTAAKFIRAATDHKLSMKFMLDQMEERVLNKQVEQATEAEVEQAIGKIMEAIQREASTKPATPPPPQPEPPAPAEKPQEKVPELPEDYPSLW